MGLIRNSDKPPKNFRSWMDYWRHIKKNGLSKETVIRTVCHDELRPTKDNYGEVVVHEYEYSLSHVKQMCFEEIESKEPLDWDEEMIGQARHIATCAKTMFHCDKIGDWLIATSEKEWEAVYHKRKYEGA